MTYFAFIVRWFSGLTFLSSSLDKSDDWNATKEALSNYGVFPGQQIGMFAGLLLGWETGLGILLLSGFFARLASVLAAVTYAGFAALMAYQLTARGGKIKCGCGGIFGDHEVSWWLVLRSLGLALVAAAGTLSGVAWPTDWLPMVLIAVGIAFLVWLLSSTYALVKLVNKFGRA